MFSKKSSFMKIFKIMTVLRKVFEHNIQKKVRVLDVAQCGIQKRYSEKKFNLELRFTGNGSVAFAGDKNEQKTWNFSDCHKKQQKMKNK